MAVIFKVYFALFFVVAAFGLVKTEDGSGAPYNPVEDMLRAHNLAAKYAKGLTNEVDSDESSELVESDNEMQMRASPIDFELSEDEEEEEEDMQMEHLPSPKLEHVASDTLTKSAADTEDKKTETTKAPLGTNLRSSVKPQDFIIGPQNLPKDYMQPPKFEHVTSSSFTKSLAGNVNKKLGPTKTVSGSGLRSSAPQNFLIGPQNLPKDYLKPPTSYGSPRPRMQKPSFVGGKTSYTPYPPGSKMRTFGSTQFGGSRNLQKDNLRRFETRPNNLQVTKEDLVSGLQPILRSFGLSDLTDAQTRSLADVVMAPFSFLSPIFHNLKSYVENALASIERFIRKIVVFIASIFHAILPSWLFNAITPYEIVRMVEQHQAMNTGYGFNRYPGSNRGYGYGNAPGGYGYSNY